MKWICLVAAMSGPAMAQGILPESDAGISRLRIELTLSANVGLKSDAGRIILRGPQGDHDTALLLAAQDGPTYRFRLADRAVSLPVSAVFPAFPLCRKSAIGTDDLVSYRLLRPGIKPTAMQRLTPSDLPPC